MYAIVGASGHIGSQLARILLDAGASVRVIGRSQERLLFLRTRGAETCVGDVLDTDFLARSFSGAAGVLSLIPPNPIAKKVRENQNQASISIIKALMASGIKNVVNISSIGAELSANTGPIVGLHDHENRLNEISGINVIHLRAAYFMENLLNTIELIREKGINGSALSGSLRMPVIATRDIAAAAARLLLDGGFKGKSVKYLLGQRDLTMEEMTRILGKAIGKPGLAYVQFRYEDAISAMIAMGMSSDMAHSYAEMSRAFNEGLIRKVERTVDNTTPTAFEWFAELFADAYCAGDMACRAIGS